MFACPNFDRLIDVSYSSWSNQDYAKPNLSCVILVAPRNTLWCSVWCSVFFFFLSFFSKKSTKKSTRGVLEQARLHNAERQHKWCLEIRNFFCLISRFSLFNLEMNGPDVVAHIQLYTHSCTHFVQLSELHQMCATMCGGKCVQVAHILCKCVHVAHIVAHILCNSESSLSCTKCVQLTLWVEDILCCHGPDVVAHRVAHILLHY